MSRIAKRVIIVPINVQVILCNQKIIIKGINGELSYIVNDYVKINYLNNILTFKGRSQYISSWMQAGTARSLIQSMITGVTVGFSKKLIFSGVGYRITLDCNNILNMSLGFSHPIIYKLPIGIFAEVLTQTELVLKGANKQLLGQVAADIRSYRKPEPYKGKGIRYEHEFIRIKEAKKK
ncbi:50S ribosomal protein L6 [Buchnera aphidicola (Nipponaphis monzeni)]|uniref:50S ribosomal protein L6 n=1 Tax=Buchnera aphidicola (Nipponaphis monzeni) TaxID=2495405 RepID=A0A455TAM7_9GAMM|nr:50S ribosomal protein L6 [Buchnera aphidicola]BBI01386.1 50S ribosomal protein L6 [Buchnera aphidicola (Nipponaphis monzeni)]